MPLKSGRGRGRTRGGSPARNGGAQEDPETQGELSHSAEPLNSIPLTFSTPSAFQRQQDVSQSSSPNSSPASVPTETPAPTPARPPVQRLDSLVAGGRGGSGAARGVGGRTMSGRIKPKAVRRGLEEREQAEREEKARRRVREIEAQMEADTDATRSSGRLGGGSGRGDGGRDTGRWRGRGRGDAMGKGWLDRNTKALREASGVFGVAPAAAERKPASTLQGMSSTPKAAADGSLNTWTQDTTKDSHSNAKPSKSTKVKQDPDAVLRPTIDGPAVGEFETQAMKIKLEIPEPIYPEEQEESNQPAPRIDIEQINLVTDDEDSNSDVVDNSTKNKGKGRMVPNKGDLRPIRLHRVEHKERVTIVNTEPAAMFLVDDAKELDASSETDAFFVSPNDDDTDRMQLSRDGKNWSEAWQDDEVEIKYDPTASTDTMDLDITSDAGTWNKSPKIPERRLAGEHEIKMSHSNGKGKSKHLRKSSSKARPPALQTEEDRAEYERHLKDIQILVRELVGLQGPLVVEGDTGTTNLELSDEQPRVNGIERQLYLFQFPPVLPPLCSKIKKEEAMNEDLELMEVEVAPPTAAETIDLIKPDSEEAVLVKAEPSLSATLHTVPEVVREEGFIGKLVVRQSGRVELDWGGAILTLGRGIECDYLRTTVVLEEQRQEERYDAIEMRFGNERPQVTGVGTGLGKVMGMFIATPDWDWLTGMD